MLYQELPQIDSTPLDGWARWLVPALILAAAATAAVVLLLLGSWVFAGVAAAAGAIGAAISIGRSYSIPIPSEPLLAGPDYTLADICNFAIANGMQHGFSQLVNEKDTPRLMDWIARINERPACKEMFAKTQRENLAPPEAAKADA